MSTEPRGSGSRPNRLDIGIALAVGFFTASAAAAQTYELVHAFRNSGQPRSNLIQASDGYFYGTTYFGGTCGVGTAFRMDSTGNVTTLHSFCYADGAQPAAGLIQSDSGDFYGTTTRGGTSNLGTVFRMDSSGNVTIVHSFHGSDGAVPDAALLQVGDAFYGTTFEGGTGLGTIFKMNSSGALDTLHTFSGLDGASPYAPLIQASDGDFYGTTAGGGDASGHGTVFRMDSSGTLTPLHVFNSPTDGANPYARLVEGSDGYFYGTTTSGGEFRGSGNDLPNRLPGNLHDASHLRRRGGVRFVRSTRRGDPRLLLWNDRNRGTALFGVSYGRPGTRHRRSPIRLRREDLCRLAGDSDGAFLGTAAEGGTDSPGLGAVFRVDSLDNFETLYTFQSTEPTTPQSALIEANDGNLYGTTNRGGANDLGTVFRMESVGQTTLLHSFHHEDGARPEAALLQADDGSFYGTTPHGGSGDQGTAFRMDVFGNLTTIHAFSGGADGGIPLAALIQASDGAFYGTTFVGGANAQGIVFKLDSTGDVVNLHSLGYPEGSSPHAALLQALDGDFSARHTTADQTVSEQFSE